MTPSTADRFVQGAPVFGGSPNADRLIDFLSFFNYERDWLEFKHSWLPGPSEQGKEVQNDSHRWHIVKDLIALANSRGGALMIGVADDGQIEGISGADKPRPPNSPPEIDKFIRGLKIICSRARRLIRPFGLMARNRNIRPSIDGKSFAISVPHGIATRQSRALAYMGCGNCRKREASLEIQPILCHTAGHPPYAPIRPLGDVAQTIPFVLPAVTEELLHSLPDRLTNTEEFRSLALRSTPSKDRPFVTWNMC